MKRLAGCLAFLLTLITATATADPTSSIPSRFDRWTSDSGLPQSSVYSIVQTKDGYLWFTTLDGLVRYDGVQFNVYNGGNTKGLAGNRFTCLMEARDGTLWIGSEDGFVYAFKDQLAVAHAMEDGSRPIVRAIREGRNGTIWIRTGGTRAYRLDKGARAAKALTPTSPPSRAIESLGTFASYDGSTLSTFEEGEIRVYGPGTGIPDLRKAQVSDDQRGRTWIRTEAGKAFVIEKGRVKPLSLEIPDPFSPESMPFCLDSKGNIWVGVFRVGLLRIDPAGVRTLYTESAGYDPTYRIVAIFEDREGNIWLGSDGGLYRFKGDLISNISSKDGLPEDNTNVVLEDRKGAFWIGGHGLVNRYHEGTITPFPYEGYLGTALLEDRKGRIWVGSRSIDHPICRIEDGHMERISIPGLVNGGVVKAILEDSHGMIWVGTSERLARLRADGGFDEFNTSGGLAGNDVNALLEDPDGAIWIGTYGGLSKIVQGRLVSFPGQAGFAGERIRTLFQDREGVLWVGTYDRGLIRYKNGGLTRFDTKTGLFSDGVFTILEDQTGYFWISCNTGIYRVRKRELDAVAEGRSTRVNSVAYGRDDGMLHSECNGGKQPSAVKTRDGRMLFASQGGVVVVDPRTRPYNTITPTVHVEEVVSGGERLDSNGELRVQPDVENFEIRYTSPSFVKPELVRFKYRIEGLEKDWVDAGTRRVAYYTYLPPGNYTFLVMAANCDGVWSAEPARLRVVALAPFWRTKTAYSLYVIGLIALVFAGIRLRTGQLRRRSQQLEELVALRTSELAGKAEELSETVERLQVSEQAALQAREDALKAREDALDASRAKSVFLSNMSHELRSPLNAVLGFAQLMERGPDLGAENREHLAVIRRSGEHLLSLINEVLSIAKIEAGKLSLNVEPFDLHQTLQSVEAMIRVRAEAKGLWFRVQSDDALPAVVLGDEAKLRQVLINLLGNAVKFTDQGGVTLRATWSGTVGASGRASFAIEDTGQGIAEKELPRLFEPFGQTERGRTEKEGTGLGLVISRQIVGLMGGGINVVSQLGQGSTFTFDVELGVSEQAPVREERRKVIGLAPGQAGIRLLVVDDGGQNRLLMRSLLSSVGFQVREAVDGEEAIRIWQEWRPELIWMDMRMPVMDGYEATRRIREAEANAPGIQSVRIIALTASAFEHERETILATGCDDFVSKPFEADVIFEKLAEHCAVRFVYAEPVAGPLVDGEGDASALVPERIAALPVALVEGLHRALTRGDVEAATRTVERIRKVDGPLAQALLSRIEGFQFEELCSLLERLQPDA